MPSVILSRHPLTPLVLKKKNKSISAFDLWRKCKASLILVWLFNAAQGPKQRRIADKFKWIWAISIATSGGDPSLRDKWHRKRKEANWTEEWVCYNKVNIRNAMLTLSGNWKNHHLCNRRQALALNLNLSEISDRISQLWKGVKQINPLADRHMAWNSKMST